MRGLLLLYAIGVPVGFLLYFLGFKVGLFSWYDIVFYRGVLVLLATTLIHGLLLTAFVWFVMQRQVSLAHALSVVMISFSVCSTFLIVIPVSLDRAVSVFILGYMKNMNRPLTRSELSSGLENIYIKKYQAAQRRIDEQIKSHNILPVVNEKFILSPQGELFVALSRVIVDILNIDKKFIDPDTD